MTKNTTSDLGYDVRVAAAIGLAVFLASLFGIFTRPMGELASVWPANALFLGLLARNPGVQILVLASVTGLVGYVAADLLTGSDWEKAILLNVANEVGVITGAVLFSRVSEQDRRLRGRESVLRMTLIVLCASCVTGLAGAAVNPILFHESALEGLLFWSVGEMSTYLAFLPLFLTVPMEPWRLGDRRKKTAAKRIDFKKLMPAAALVLSCGFSMVIGGPGAVVFPMPALLWCALTYTLFQTNVLTFLFSGWMLAAISFGWLSLAISTDQALHAILSLRFGLALENLGPLTVASIMAVRTELMRKLEAMATYDQLTGLLNRRAFLEACTTELNKLSTASQPVAALMLDIDHFKSVNDTYGHAGGDCVLRGFGKIVGKCLRDSDALGRLGGEEFAILLPNCPKDVATAIGNRIRATLADTPVDVGDDKRISATVSIGIAFSTPATENVDALLNAADEALYHAKKSGRNRVEVRDYKPGSETSSTAKETAPASIVGQPSPSRLAANL